MNNSSRYVDVLQELVQSYNVRYHISSGMKSVNVIRDKSRQVRKRVIPVAKGQMKNKPAFSM